MKIKPRLKLSFQMSPNLVEEEVWATLHAITPVEFILHVTREVVPYGRPGTWNVEAVLITGEPVPADLSWVSQLALLPH